MKPRVDHFSEGSDDDVRGISFNNNEKEKTADNKWMIFVSASGQTNPTRIMVNGKSVRFKTLVLKTQRRQNPHPSSISLFLQSF